MQSRESYGQKQVPLPAESAGGSRESKSYLDAATAELQKRVVRERRKGPIYEPFSREQTSISAVTTVTITVELPWGELPISGKKEETITPDGLFGKCVLCVDDSMMNREITAALLENVGVEVKTATNGKKPPLRQSIHSKAMR